jgi:hypothetical protein
MSIGSVIHVWPDSAAGLSAALQVGHNENRLRGIAYKKIGAAAGHIDADTKAVPG